MMYAPKCHDHRSLVFAFALGRLDDRDAMRAEHVLGTCEVCQAWWAENFECSEITLVDDAVGEVLSSVELPRRHTYRHAWAAAAALVIGILALWQTLPAPQIQHVPTGAAHEISGFDFESGVNASKLDSSLAGDAIARMDFESAIVIASATAVAAVMPDSAGSETSGEQLAGFDFESGVLVGLNPQT